MKLDDLWKVAALKERMESDDFNMEMMEGVAPEKVHKITIHATVFLDANADKRVPLTFAVHDTESAQSFLKWASVFFERDKEIIADDLSDLGVEI